MDALFDHPSVFAVVIATEEGFPLAFRAKNSTFGGGEAEITAALISALIGRTKNAVERIGRGKVNFFTIDATEGEILIALEQDYIVIALRTRSN